MAEYRYNAYFKDWVILIGSEGIQYGKTENLRHIPRSEMKGIGVAFTHIDDALGYSSGGILGKLAVKKMRKKIQGAIPEEVTKEMKAEELPKTHALLVITYQPIGSKQKSKTIPLNLKDPICISMIKQIQNDMSDIYIGAGPQMKIYKELKISQALGVTIVIIIVILVAALVTFYAR